jgi:hypothetical protein
MTPLSNKYLSRMFHAPLTVAVADIKPQPSDEGAVMYVLLTPTAGQPSCAASRICRNFGVGRVGMPTSITLQYGRLRAMLRRSQLAEAKR